jgi:H+-transporting ATPase
MDIDKVSKTNIEDLFKELESSRKGLTDESVKSRLEKYGANEIIEKRVNPILKFFSYFWGPIPWMIEIAAILSAVIQRWDDCGVIVAMLMVNAIIAFWQEHKADNAIQMLKKKLALNARVLRDGKWKQIPSRELVPGDIIRVRLGEIMPADVKLFEGEYLQVDESALTGESLPVEKKTGDIGYSGSVIKQGEMDCLVVGTGMNTYFGKTAKLVEKAKTRSHFQRAVIKIGDYLILMAFALVSLIFVVSLFRHENIFKILQFSLILIVASIPVALPAVLTVTMAVGAAALARRQAIVSRLVAIEEMAGVDVLCSDKTGTITKGELKVKEIWPVKGFSENDLLEVGVLASREEDNDPIDNVVLEKAKEIKEIAEAVKKLKVSGFKPFDPSIKRTEATVEGEGKKYKVTKGAPQIILNLLENKSELAADVNKQVEDFAAKGYRALGLARTNEQGKWTLVGLMAIYDAPRDDSAETIKTAQDMGISVKMVTGDHVAVAKEIAHEVGLGTNIEPSATALMNKPDREFRREVEQADGFAEVFPEHKFHIVENLQKGNHIVGMTGDGVNDAPALKKADAGIAVAGATDAAKSAAAIVLTSPGLSVIVDAIKESRRIFKRMNSYAIYRLAETMRVLFFMTLAILIFNFYPVTAIMIVILAMLNDIPIMMIAYDKTKIYQFPVKWNMRRVLSLSTVLGIYGVFESFGMFYIGENVFHLGRETIQTLMFLKLTVAGHMTIYLARTGEEHFWAKPYPAAALFLTAELTQLTATLFAVYGILMPPLGWKLAGFVWLYAFVFFVLADYVKIYVYKLMDHFGIRFRRDQEIQPKSI